MEPEARQHSENADEGNHFGKSKASLAASDAGSSAYFILHGKQSCHHMHELVPKAFPVKAAAFLGVDPKDPGRTGPGNRGALLYH